VIGEDNNGYIGSERRENERLDEGYSFEEGNKTRERVLDFTLFYDFAIINTYFRKREEHYITFKSGGNRS